MDNINLVSEAMNKINSDFNNRYDVIDSKAPKRDIVFDAGKIIESLISSGVPLLNTFHVLDEAKRLIFCEHKNTILKTSEISGYIRSSLHCLERFGVSAHACQEWGDTYVRKYGNPHGKMKVIHRDGTFDDLDFEYVKTHLLPEILSEICSMPTSKLSSVFHRKDFVDMANELMNVIQGFGLYRIHHRTLLLLSMDIALQPPHPWFPTNTQALDNVEYDMERANHHLEVMRISLENRVFPRARNSFRECLSHCASALLAYYNEVLGCGELAPFHNLREAIKSIQDHSDDIRIKNSKIHLLSQDICLIGLSLSDLQELLSRLNHLLQIIYREDAVKESFEVLQKYFEITRDIVSAKYLLKTELEKVTALKTADKGISYENVVCNILKLCPDLIIHRNTLLSG